MKNMAVKIMGVSAGSPAEKAGIRPGETLFSVNGHDIGDVLDYRFYTTEKRLELVLDTRTLRVKKQEYEDLGLEFETYLMAEKLRCRNNCVFCFISQLPQGMRETLYFKDDDARLSFLQGNYITLTNLTDSDVDRIITMRLDMNISVHTTNPELRSKMLKNPHAGESLRHLRRMAAAGIRLNCQLVLCPGWNDGEELESTLTELTGLYPSVRSICCVPVGLSAHREGLVRLEAFTKEGAAAVVEIIERFGDETLRRHGDRLVYPSDEFFLLAEKPMPDYAYYGDFAQYENGVGMWTSLETEFTEEMAEYHGEAQKGRLSIATGMMAAPLMESLMEKIRTAYGTEINVYAIRNDFFGESITVAGLVTGRDLIAQLLPHKEALGECLLLPRAMLKADEDIFLDDVGLADVENALGVGVIAVENDGARLFRLCTGEMIGET